jgi:hypothetical protein
VAELLNALRCPDTEKIK